MLLLLLTIIIMTVAIDSFGQNEGGFECRVKEVNLNLMSKTYFYSFIQFMLSECLHAPGSVLALGLQMLPLPSRSLLPRPGPECSQGPAALVGGVPRTGWHEQQPAARVPICRGLPLLSPILRMSGDRASNFTKEAGNL